MNNDKNPKQQTYIALSDIWRLAKRSKFKILSFVLLMTLLGGIFALIQPIEYQADGTFREKSPKSGATSNLFMDVLTTGSFSNNADNEALTILKSKKLIHPIIEKLNLQGKITTENSEDSYFKRILANSLVTQANISKKVYPVLLDSTCPLKVESIKYSQELPLNFKVIFPDISNHFQLIDPTNQVIGHGELNNPYKDKDLEFTIVCSHPEFKRNTHYSLNILPLDVQIRQTRDKLSVENDPKDKNLLKISFRNRDRHLAKEFVNILMENYHAYLHADHQRQAALQLSYLKEKQNEAEKNLGELMFKHASSLSEDLSKTGFADSEKEMEFLAKSQHEFKERLISNELEIKRLQNVQTGKCVYYDQYVRNQGDHNIINSVLEEIRNWKQQRDGLALALKKSQFLKPEDLELAFLSQQKELADVKNSIEELNQMIEVSTSGKTIETSSKLFNDDRYIIKAWYERIQSNDFENITDEYEQFLDYLYNLRRLFFVHETVIKERLIHQQNPSLEFQGINLKTSQELYLDYSRRLSELEAKKRENIFLINQMEDPNFEITSLSTVLNDSVSNEMIQKASRLLLDLKDQNNRSDKEQLQLRDELHLERTFLLLHLQQTNQLLILHQELVEEKINSLQNITLELIHQQISVLEKNLYDYIETRLENLKQERALIEQHMTELHQEMAALPQRWVTEKMIDQNLEINELIVQEVAKMVESKNISHRLELIQSAPVDLASLPVHPLSPNFVLFSALGAIMGSLLSLGYLFKKGLAGDVPVSSTNLKLLNQQVLGKFSTAYVKNKHTHTTYIDLETLRRLKCYLDDNSLISQKWLLIQGNGPDYSKDLASLLKINGKKSIRLFLNFDQPATDGNFHTGLLQFLEGQIKMPLISKDEIGDYIETGGTTRFYNELLGTDAFQNLLHQLSKDYSYILAISSSPPESAVAEYLTTLFARIAVTITEEKLNQINFYVKETLHTNKKIGFIITAQDDAG